MTAQTTPQETVRLHYDTPHVAVVTLDNPPMNTLSWESRDALAGILDKLESDDAVRCIVLTGAGPVFTAGAELKEEGEAMTNDRLPAFLEGLHRMLAGTEQLRAPVVAAINGPCIGGGLELALACDIRVASTKATFVAAGVNVGLIASVCALPQIVGEGRAKHMLLTGQPIDALQAERWGLVTALHDPDRLLPAALEIAHRIASRAPLSVEATKGAVRRLRDLDGNAATEVQQKLLLELFATNDHKEAVRAFFEKRPGNFHRQ